MQSDPDIDLDSPENYAVEEEMDKLILQLYSKHFTICDLVEHVLYNSCYFIPEEIKCRSKKIKANFNLSVV